MNIITTTTAIFLSLVASCCSQDALCATVCNSGTVSVPVIWELEFIENGPPVYGDYVAKGTFLLQPDQCRTVSHIPYQAGNYEWVFVEKEQLMLAALIFAEEGRLTLNEIRSGPCVIPELLPETGGIDPVLRSGFLALVLGLMMIIFGQIESLARLERKRIL